MSRELLATPVTWPNVEGLPTFDAGGPEMTTLVTLMAVASKTAFQRSVILMFFFKLKSTS
jgi:hypothetical protein